MKNLENKEKKHHRDVYKYKEKIKWRASNIKYRWNVASKIVKKKISNDNICPNEDPRIVTAI